MKTQLFEAAPGKSAQGTLILFPVCAIEKVWINLLMNLSWQQLLSSVSAAFPAHAGCPSSSLYLLVSSGLQTGHCQQQPSALVPNKGRKKPDETCEISLEDKNQIVFSEISKALESRVTSQ